MYVLNIDVYTETRHRDLEMAIPISVEFKEV